MRTVRLLCLALLVTAPVWAQLSEIHASWPSGPVGALLSADERAAFSGLGSDTAAGRFVELFWARRDPDPGTRENTVREDFEARVAAADRQLGQGETRGSLTDRGRVLLLMGAPTRHWTAPLLDYLTDLYRDSPPDAASAVDRTLSWHGVTFDRGKAVVDVWEYDRDRLPAAALGATKSKVIVFAFLDPEGTGTFTRATSIRGAADAAEVLEAMPATFLLHPELTEPPTYPLVKGSRVATPTELAWLELDPAPWPAGAAALATVGVAFEDDRPGWVFVSLPAGTPAADLAVGRLTRADGTVQGSFAVTIQGRSLAKGTSYELSVPTPVGTSTLALALAAAGQPVAVRSLELERGEETPGGCYLGPVLAGAEVQEIGQFEAGAPFVFGGYHLVVRPDGDYDWTDSLNYFCFVVRPGAAEGQQPKVTVQERFRLGGRQAPAQPAREAQLSPVAPNVYMLGSQLPLSAFRQGGEYTLKVTIKDTVSGTERSTEIPLRLPPKIGE